MYNRYIIDRANRGIISDKNASFSLKQVSSKNFLINNSILKNQKLGGVLISSGIGKRFEKFINAPLPLFLLAT